jgi:hypothetical protein
VAVGDHTRGAQACKAQPPETLLTCSWAMALRPALAHCRVARSRLKSVPTVVAPCAGMDTLSYSLSPVGPKETEVVAETAGRVSEPARRVDALSFRHVRSQLNLLIYYLLTRSASIRAGK